MSRTALWNGVAVTAALVLSVLLAGGPRPPRSSDPAASVTDAGGAAVELREYHRIASASTVADRLLLELCDASRIVAFTAASAEGPDGHRFRGRPTIASLDEVEHVIGLRSDLLLVHNVADARRVERLREAGLSVFDLGALRGRASLGEDIEQVAALCGAPERGRSYARRLSRRLDSVAGDVGERRTAIYLSFYGDRLYGGTTGTSYHDVLEAGGLRDAAAGRFDGWPQYTVEQVLELDPELIVTRDGMRASVCEHPVLSRLRACPAAVIEIDAALLDAPGPGMLEAAEAVHEAVSRLSSPP